MRASALSTATALNQQMHFVCFGRIVSRVRWKEKGEIVILSNRRDIFRDEVRRAPRQIDMPSRWNHLIRESRWWNHDPERKNSGIF